MAQRVSRRKLADYTADQLMAGKKKVLQEMAAYLIETGREREAELLARDIEFALSERGVTVVRAASAHELTSALRKQIESLVGGTVHLKETVDPTLLGGVRVDTPGQRFDGTLSHKLAGLKAKQW
jgi:F-type H+-transporting ATPase subunit delta